MQNTDKQPILLLDGSVSPHSFQLKPSQVKVINSADIVFYINNDFEYFLKKAVKNSKAFKIQLSKSKGLKLIELSDHKSHDHDGHHHGNYDYHVWLSPNNAELIIKQIARTLSLKYPDNKEIYNANLEQSLAEIQELDKNIAADISEIGDAKYILFHDSYRYFERDYGIKNSGLVRINVNSQPSAKHLRNLRDKIRNENIKCIFTEPQFGSDIIGTISLGLEVNTGTLDPLGQGIAAGKEMYNQLVNNISQSIAKCLK